MKIVSIVGARPQFIKAAPVSSELRKNHTEILVHTGQHYDKEISDVFFDDLKIPKPDYYLGVGSGTHGYQIGEILKRVETVLLKEKPDRVLVYGDTNSTLAGALAASKLSLAVGHVEAGLRSFDRTMPEELNRILTDHMSDLLFVPTQTAITNLKTEGIAKGIHKVGDVMYDVLLRNLKLAEHKTNILNALKLETRMYLLVTVHRPSNTDIKKNLENIIQVLITAKEPVIFPIHPRTLKYLKLYGLYKKLINSANVVVTKPLGYFDFLTLMKNAHKILTDSGGIQKEAYMLKIPCITLRENSEWVETIDDGWNVLVGANKKKILDAIRTFEPKRKQRNLFGDGHASRRIRKILETEKI